jgi:hypothetical protein
MHYQAFRRRWNGIGAAAAGMAADADQRPQPTDCAVVNFSD